MKENESNVNRKRRMLIAGDVGGTKTLLGVFERTGARPRLVSVRSFATLDFTDLPSMIRAFLRDCAVAGDAITSAAFGVAGPVIDNTAELTNVPWRVDGPRVAREFALEHVTVLNDLQAMAYSVPVLQADELHVLQEGRPVRGGNIAVIAAGTGLGEALLHSIDGRFIPSPSEGGHADYAPRTEREIELLRDLVRRYGRADVEHVVSGRGILNIFRVVHKSGCRAGIQADDPDAPAAITSAAFDRRCAACVETLDVFVDSYGAEAGNLALRSVSTGGVFVGGGIAPKILPALTTGAFMRAFRDKPPLEPMLEAMPVKVILNAQAGLLGAAVYAANV